MAPTYMLHIGNLEHNKGTVSDNFSTYCFFQHGPEGILAKDTNPDWLAGAGEGVWRPFDELCKVE